MAQKNFKNMFGQLDDGITIIIDYDRDKNNMILTTAEIIKLLKIFEALNYKYFNLITYYKKKILIKMIILKWKLVKLKEIKWKKEKNIKTKMIILKWK